MNKDDSIDQFVVTSRSDEEISFDKLTKYKTGEYIEVFASQASLVTGIFTQSAIQFANQSITLAKIAAQAPYGLYTATVTPEKLSRFQDGTFTTIVKKGSKIEKHAGFTEVSFQQSLNPMMFVAVGMQAMSIISGSYYLNQINSHMVKIEDKLEELLNIHHDENIGKMISARKALSQIVEREVIDIIDVNAIRNYKKTADEILEEYSYRLHRKEDELVKSKKIEEKKLDDINFYMSIVFEASKLSLYTELIEIGSRMKMGGQTKIIDGLIKQLKKNYINSFYYKINSEVDSFYSIIKSKYESELSSKQKMNNKIDKIVNEIPAWNWGILIKYGAKAAVVIKDNVDVSEANKNEKNRQLKIENVKSSVEINKNNDPLDDVIVEMLQSPYKKSEIVYIYDENPDKQRVFVPLS